MVNLTALPTRLISTCWIRCSSPCQCCSSLGSILTSIIIDLDLAFCLKLPMTCSMSVRRLNLAVRNCSMPWSILEKSKTLFTSLVNCWLALLRVTKWPFASPGSWYFCKTSIMPKIPFKGVRTSWLRVVKKRPLASLARSALALARSACTLAVYNSWVRWLTACSNRVLVSWLMVNKAVLADCKLLFKSITRLNIAMENITISARAPKMWAWSVTPLLAIMLRLTRFEIATPVKNMTMPMANKLALVLPVKVAYRVRPRQNTDTGKKTISVAEK